MYIINSLGIAENEQCPEQGFTACQKDMISVY